MNPVRSSDKSMVQDMLLEVNGVNPILIAWDALHEHDTEVRVHPCDWKGGCRMHIPVELKQVSKHLKQHHGINTSATSGDTQKITCLWTGCLDTHTKPGNLSRHVLTQHLGVRWICSKCGSSLSREDAFRRHSLESSSCQSAEVVVDYGDGSRVIDLVYINGGWSASQNVILI
ncbi:hypothetical protein BDR06DRAFT_331387 [Suillus hirtellus]|nr:hypothetical protein BDR06DRAFT_331387 [Suillus hirtellus]